MRRESLDIRIFDKGLISNPDQEDIALGAATKSDDVDGDADGYLRGIKNQATEHATFGKDGTVSAWIKRDSGEWDLIYSDPTEDKCEAITDFYGTKAEADQLTSYTPTTIVPNNQEVHIGAGTADNAKWVGYCEHSQFSNEDLDDVFDGSGLDDATGDVTGYTGTTNVSFEVEIDAAGTPDTFKWKKNGGSYTSGVSITGSAQTLSDGVTITFAATTGHTLADKWYVTRYINTGLQVDDAECDNLGSILGLDVTDNEGAEGSGSFLTTIRYSWGVSCVYDGYQESPLLTFTDVPGTQSSTWTVNIQFIQGNSRADLISPRITDVKLYRAESTDTTVGEIGTHRLLDTISLDDADWAVASDTARLEYAYTDSYDKQKTSYEQETGMPETLTDIGGTIDGTIVKYEFSCALNHHLFVAKCNHSELPDAALCLFRSKGYRYDMIDWSNDILRLPTLPTGMIGYNGVVYVFDEDNMYSINPNSLHIMDTFEGVGLAAHRAAIVTEFGMFWADGNHIYRMVGSQITPISDPIRTTWQADADTPHVVFDSARKLVIFYKANLGYAYHVLKNRWDMITNPLSSATIKGAFTGKDGESYIMTDDAGDEDALYDNFGGANRRDFTYRSGEISLNDSSQLKKFYHWIVDGSQETGTAYTVKYSIDAGANWRSLTNTDEIKDGSGDWEHKKTIMLEIATSDTNDAVIDSASLIYRRMRGKRD